MPISKTFTHHVPSPTGGQTIAAIRAAFSNLQAELDRLLPMPSREKAVAITNLETSAMWATKAVVMNDPLSKVSE